VKPIAVASLSLAALVPALRSQVPIDIGRDEARTAARRELSKQEYQRDQPGLAERALRWVWDQINELLDRAANTAPFGWAGLAVIAAVIVVAVIALRLRLGPMAGRAKAAQVLFSGRPMTAAEHRAAAAAHESAGEWAQAIRERLRAVIRGLEERGLLDPRPGRTADESATEAGAVVPGCATELRAGAQTFDDIWYGGRPATEEAARSLRALDQQVAAAQPFAARVMGGHDGK
jgi:hypothetical protein